MPDGTISAPTSNANALDLVDNILMLNMVFAPLTAQSLFCACRRFFRCRQARCLRKQNLLQYSQCYGEVLLKTNKC
jgi:hypothetical protein